jgi:sugar/nucleoside kinase (ribokinase family)
LQRPLYTQARRTDALGKRQRHIGGGRSIAVPAALLAKVVDTTGAGDLYAAGFLYGVATGKGLATAGRD